MKIEIIRCKNRDELMDFVKFPYLLYKDDKNWIPPLFSEQKRWVLKRETPLFNKNPSLFIIAKIEDRVMARVAVVEDRKINREKKQNFAYFTMLETVKCFPVFQKLMEEAEKWAKERNLMGIVGPVSPTRGDHYKGMLVWGFNTRPAIMNSHNPYYYREFIERLGYTKLRDLYGYLYMASRMNIEERMKMVDYAMKRYGFRVDKFNFKNIEKEARDIEYILKKSKSVWPDVIFPDYEEIIMTIKELKKFADRDLLFIARDKDSLPIGFNVILPDYNVVFKKLKGKMHLKEMIKFLYFKRKIRGVRMFVMFVVPEYWKKGVAHAIYFTALKNGMEKSYIYADGSTIDETNTFMRRDAEKLGGIHYRTYRIYKKLF